MKLQDETPSPIILMPEYFARPAQVLARELIGAVIVRRLAGAGSKWAGRKLRFVAEA